MIDMCWYTVITKKLLEWYKIVWIMISLDMFIENLIPLSSTYLVVRFPLNMENCVDLLTKKAYLEITIVHV